MSHLTGVPNRDSTGGAYNAPPDS